MKVEQLLEEKGVTEADIRTARETDGLSWKAIAEKLGLGSPSTARKAWEVLTGSPHSEAKGSARAQRRIKGRKPKRVTLRPKWGNDSESEEVTEAIANRKIVVRRETREDEEIRVGKVLYYDIETPSGKPVPMTVTFTEGNSGRCRSVFVQDIVKVR